MHLCAAAVRTEEQQQKQEVPASPVLPEQPIVRESAALWLRACIKQEQQAAELARLMGLVIR